MSIFTRLETLIGSAETAVSTFQTQVEDLATEINDESEGNLADYICTVVAQCDKDAKAPSGKSFAGDLDVDSDKQIAQTAINTELPKDKPPMLIERISAAEDKIEKHHSALEGLNIRVTVLENGGLDTYRPLDSGNLPPEINPNQPS